MMAYRIGGIDRGKDHHPELETSRVTGTTDFPIEGSGHEAMRGEEATTGLLGGHGNEAIRQIHARDEGTRGTETIIIEDE